MATALCVNMERKMIFVGTRGGNSMLLQFEPQQQQQQEEGRRRQQQGQGPVALLKPKMEEEYHYHHHHRVDGNKTNSGISSSSICIDKGKWATQGVRERRMGGVTSIYIYVYEHLQSFLEERSYRFHASFHESFQ
jgi:hypothetical protein